MPGSQWMDTATPKGPADQAGTRQPRKSTSPLLPTQPACRPRPPSARAPPPQYYNRMKSLDLQAQDAPVMLLILAHDPSPKNGGGPARPPPLPPEGYAYRDREASK